MYNDIVATICRGNGAMFVYLILLRLLTQLIMIICLAYSKTYVGIRGIALKLIKSNFSNRTQCVQIDNVLSEFKIGYHVYDDNIQLYISF